MSEVWIPIVGILILFGGPIVYMIVNRTLSYVERVEMIKRGMIPPDFKGRAMPPPPWNGGAPVPPPAPGWGDYQATMQLRKGISVAMVGFALTVGLSFIGFGPWLLGGLVPMFVGIAQIIIAVLSGAQFSVPARPASFGPVPPNTPPPPPDASSAPYGWRPGPTTELQGPKPPDVRG